MSLPAPTLRQLRRLVTVVETRGAPWPEIGRALDREIDACVEWGPCVFRWLIPLTLKTTARTGKRAGQTLTMQLCPLLNVYGSLEVWQRARLYEHLDALILQERVRWPGCQVANKAERRGVRVTRSSSHEPDALCTDCFGKVHIDRLVLAGILAGDTQQLLLREARWQRVSPGKGSLQVEIFRLV